MNSNSFANIYSQKPFEDTDVPADPFDLFAAWYRKAKDDTQEQADIMFLATVDSAGQPECRAVLLKGFIQQVGFKFFTNYHSDKARHLDANSKASVTFFWPDHGRQVRVGGRAEKLPVVENHAYFQSRPRESQLAAWASEQSRALSSRTELDDRYHRFEAEYSGREIPCPDHWGGYLIKPHRFDFWQGRAARLHDRFSYEWDPVGGWQVTRRAP